MIDFEVLRDNMKNLEEEEVLSAMNEVANEADANVVVTALQDGMTGVGELFESGEYFVGDLIYAGEIMENAMNIIKPLLRGGNSERIGRMILCTVKDDLHDIGKNIVKVVLEANGFEVIDLGINVPPEVIVETAKTENIHIIALSGVLTLALETMKETVDAFVAAGMRDDVKIIIGGSCVTPESCEYVGSDEWARLPQKTVDVCKKWANA